MLIVWALWRIELIVRIRYSVHLFSLPVLYKGVLNHGESARGPGMGLMKKWGSTFRTMWQGDLCGWIDQAWTG